MILKFAKSAGGELSKGPFSLVRFEGERICDVAADRVIGAHLVHGWSVDGGDYLRLDVSQPVVVGWQDHAGSRETTGHFSCVNGVAYIDRRILAFVDRERKDWYLVRQGKHQPYLLLTPAA